jgi:hypothetical protein
MDTDELDHLAAMTQANTALLLAMFDNCDNKADVFDRMQELSALTTLSLVRTGASESRLEAQRQVSATLIETLGKRARGTPDAP